MPLVKFGSAPASNSILAKSALPFSTAICSGEAVSSRPEKRRSTLGSALPSSKRILKRTRIIIALLK